MTTPEISYRGSVYPAQCDHMGHMNVQWYVAKFDEATWNFFSDLGITPSFLRKSASGMAAVEQHIKYIRELRAGDVLTIYSRLTELSGKVIRFHHQMINGDTGDTAATTDLVALHMDLNTRKSIMFPEQIVCNANDRLNRQVCDG